MADEQGFEKVHKFELAGLGKAPYRFEGVAENVYQACPGAPIQPGGCCDYCWTGIRFEFWLLSSDGKRFKVGCDCIRKHGDAGLKKIAVTEEAKRKRELARAAAARREAKLIAALPAEWEWFETVRPMFAAMPHPNSYLAEQGATFADYVDFVGKRSGARSASDLFKRVRKMHSEQKAVC